MFFCRSFRILNLVKLLFAQLELRIFLLPPIDLRGGRAALSVHMDGAADRAVNYVQSGDPLPREWSTDKTEERHSAHLRSR
jgi:hypothetical protein